MNDNKNYTNTLNILKEEIVQLKNKIDENKFIFQVIEKSSIPLYVINKDNKIVYYNSELEKIITPTSNLINKNHSSLLYSQKEIKKAKSIIDELFQNEHALKNVHLMFKNADGKAESFVTSVTLLDSKEDDSFILFQLVKPIRDIFSDGLEKLFAEADNLGVQIIDSEGVFVYSNPIAQNWIEGDSKNIVGRTIKELLAFTDNKKLKEIFSEILSGNEITGELLEYKDKSGNSQYVFVAIRKFNSIGEYFHICFEIDVTSLEENRKKLSELNSELSSSLDLKEKELRVSEESFRALTENSEDVIMRFDRQFKHLYVNRAISNMLDISPEDMIGKTHAELGFPKKLVELWEGAIQKVFDTGKVNRIEFKLPTGVWVDWLCMPERDNDGEVKYVMTAARDITEFKHYQNRMEKYSESLAAEVEKATVDLVKHNNRLTELLKEKKQIQSKLQEREKLYSTLVNSSFDGVLLLDLQGRVLFCNPSALNLADLKDERGLLNTSVLDFLVKDDVQKARRAFAEIIKTKNKLHREFRVINNSGKTFHVDIVASPVFDSFGETESIILFVRDITEKKIAAQKIIASEQKYRELFEHSPIGLMILDTSGKIVDINPQGSKILGYKEDELIGENVSKVTAPENKSKLNLNISEIVTGNKLNHVVENIRKDGKKINVNLHERLTISDSGEKQIFVSFEDVTEKVQKEAQLIEREYRYRTLFRHSPGGIVVLSEDGFVIDVNSAFTRFTGYESWEVVDKHVGFIFKNIDRPSWDVKIRKIINGEEAKEQVKFNTRDGKARVIEFNGVRIPLEENKVGAILIIKDISEEVERLEKLEEAKKLAEQSDKLKSDFLAQISHEIRSPLTNVSGFIELLKEELDPEDPRYKVIFGSIGMSINRIFRTVELILNAAEMKQGTYEPNFEKLELVKDIITPVYNEYKSYAAHRNLKLELVLDTRSALIRADHFSLYQVFVNLVDNAIKYTKKGKIELKVYRLNRKVCVDVKDTGIGMDEDFIPKLFEEFTQEDSGYSRRFDGTGLGLALVRDYCKLNKAKIFVKSKKGKGTVFTIKF